MIAASLFLLLLVVLTTSVSASKLDDEISRFQEYLRINTAHPTPDYDKAAEFITHQAQQLSLHTEKIQFASGKPLILVRWDGRHPALPSVLLNSHTDVVPAETNKWAHKPFDAHIDPIQGNIYARGSQDMKCVGIQYLEAIRRLKNSGFVPDRTLYLSFVPDEEIGGTDGAGAFASSDKFKSLGVEVVLDEGLASPGNEYRVFYGERSPWWLVIKASGAPGHGAKLYDGSAMENLMKSVESVRRFRTTQFDLVKYGEKVEGEVVSVNLVYLKAGTPSTSGFVMNLQPSEAEVGLDIRMPPTSDPGTFERRIAEEWAPSARNMTYEFKHKVPVLNMFGELAISTADSSNPWWNLLEEAVTRTKGKLGKPEIFPASTDARFFREQGITAFGFSPMANTPILLHDHNEFLNKAEYLKGIEVYESIITAFTSYKGNYEDEESKSEL